MTREAVMDCAASGWTIPEVAEEFDVSYSTAYRFVKVNGLKHLFRHGNRRVKELKDSDIDMVANIHTMGTIRENQP
ncbi:MAG: helix-turn-helix domain-containing protein [Deltaproteobacteria bacterium]|nr:helix-turn-helix domain-containing protein [Deltaproteobacteria bacterium]